MKKTLKVILQVMLLVCLPLSGVAQTDGKSEANRLIELNLRLDTGLEQLKALNTQLENVPEMDREALVPAR